MVANVQTMAYHGEVPWHGIGTPVPMGLTADQMIRAGAPEKAAWGVALGLTVTLVWLYLEILRLLSYFQQR